MNRWFSVKEKFLTLSNKADKKSVGEINSIVDACSFDSPSKNIAIMSVMFLLSFLLENFPPKDSKRYQQNTQKRKGSSYGKIDM